MKLRSPRIAPLYLDLVTGDIIRTREEVRALSKPNEFRYPFIGYGIPADITQTVFNSTVHAWTVTLNQQQRNIAVPAKLQQDCTNYQTLKSLGQ